ncbi:AraC family transcriptional regulator [Mycolicibacterium sp. 120266]|uniref:helix-turn-helix transcriptional regulator n=1 Tax=Mycolicibacterium sp. 120266 TaxID=3090601 RepID=UPI00299CE57E|nr:AraC family transcriptional regulator [Mycolicibacterium sp. 120266]MDX1873263.1 AraC family transcriptional regulator [Mycolicibacterium sp. 120266]
MQTMRTQPRAFTTAGLPDQQRIELWESHNATALIGLRCKSLRAEVLEATEINLQLERVHLARVRGTSHVVERDETLVRARPTESVALFFNLVGEAFFYHEDGVWSLRPGQLLMCDADRPFMRGFSRGLEELVLKIPRELFAEVTEIHQLARPIVCDFSDDEQPIAHALARSVGAAVDVHEPQPIAEELLLDLIAALCASGRHDLRPAHLTAVYTYLNVHYRDSALSARRVAAAVGISTRHLSRLLAEAGTTLPEYVLNRRLQAARALLQTPAATSMTVGEVAHRCGFVSASHFSNAFTTRFGERASDVRRRAKATRSLPPA